MRILLTGGGTGGHLSPLVAVARELKKIQRERQAFNLELFYLGPNDFSRTFLANEGIKIKIITTGKLRRYVSAATFLDLFKLPIGLLQALLHVLIWMPDATFSKGGYGSLPAVMASWLYRIPIIIHESDSMPGLANRRLAPFAKYITVSFPTAAKFFPGKKTAFVGIPTRKELATGSIEEAKTDFGLSTGKPIIFIIGGSQGAQPINHLIFLTLPRLLAKYELIWQTGKKNHDSVSAEIIETLGKIPEGCHITPFLDEKQMSEALAAASLVISRASATSIFEIALCGKPSIIIPLPSSASGHQRENALEYAANGGAVLLNQENLTPNILLNEINQILNNPSLVREMSASAKAFAKPDAARQIAEELINLTAR
ncbi:MAG: undecaprenyldiphospho-muramoylpentapeptide beta-N-acetylglucosaminyltransferase [Candidatus Portnoybacteria bacterium]|nr:undecaprenyldiphospho-muramoylpentapeptide beta-N-acetylglucosaminyltransferase [Candidatus Portnoybacteria bacterium]